MIQFGQWLLRALALKLAGWLQRVAGNSQDHTAPGVDAASLDLVQAQPGAPQAGGPPPHWVEKVRKAAPHLLHPGRPNFAVPARPANELPSAMRRQPRYREEGKSTPTTRPQASREAMSGEAKPGRQRQAQVRRTGEPSRSFLKFRTEAPRTSGPVTMAEQPVDRFSQGLPKPALQKAQPGATSGDRPPQDTAKSAFASGAPAAPVRSISFPPRPERAPTNPPAPEPRPHRIREERAPQPRYHGPVLRREEAGPEIMEVSDPVEVHRPEQPLLDAPPPQFTSPDLGRHPEKAPPARHRADVDEPRIAASGQPQAKRVDLIAPEAWHAPPKAAPRDLVFPRPTAQRRDEVPVIEGRGITERWPELPEAVQPDPTERWLERRREDEHLARLEREQRGVLWIA
jgi:hypothetical protein